MEMEIVQEETSTGSSLELDDDHNKLRDDILNRVANSDGFFKSQQVGEDDLTISEKWKIADNLLTQNIPLFLQRYWKYIKLEDVSFFDSYKGNYEVDFYLKEIYKLQNLKTNKISIKNRRYEALQKMIKEGTYFSDVEMKRRSPFLYEQFIGQHLTEEERITAYKAQSHDDTFSSFLMGQMERNQENYLFRKQRDEDEAVIEEEDDDTEDESEEEFIANNVKVSDVEKNMLRNEFTNIMYENFLAGKDEEFDYSSVDHNLDYDSIEQRDLDEQEKYFDEESSEDWCDS